MVGRRGNRLFDTPRVYHEVLPKLLIHTVYLCEADAQSLSKKTSHTANASANLKKCIDVAWCHTDCHTDSLSKPLSATHSTVLIAPFRLYTHTRMRSAYSDCWTRN